MVGEEMIERCDRLQEIAKEMEKAGLMRCYDDQCVVWHWDLSASNILINSIAIYQEMGSAISTASTKSIVLDPTESNTTSDCDSSTSGAKDRMALDALPI